VRAACGDQVSAAGLETYMATEKDRVSGSEGYRAMSSGDALGAWVRVGATVHFDGLHDSLKHI
jgi:hypothetical protein